MALEVIGNAIRVTANDTSPIEAVIKDATGSAITTGNMKFIVDGTDIAVIGAYDTTNRVWVFEIPSTTLKGRYMYHFEYEDIVLEFSEPIYFE